MPADGDVTIDRAPSAADLLAVEVGLFAYNRRFAGSVEPRPLAYVLRGADGVVIGGLVGETSHGWLHIDYLWVADALRGRGWGGRLLADAEREAAGRGCTRVHLDTRGYQAPEFYRRRGYRVVGTLPDYQAGHDLVYLVKELDEAKP